MPGPLKTDPDRDLILECQRSLGEGFGGAFRQVYELYKDRVYNVCYRVTGSATDALDASQETFGIVHRKIGAFRFESRFSSWVYRIAVNASIDIKRRAASRSLTSLEALQAPLDREGGAFDVEDERTEAPSAFASRHELEKDIQRAIDRLSPKMRAIIVLRYTGEPQLRRDRRGPRCLPRDRQVSTLSGPRGPGPRAHPDCRPSLHSRRRSLTTARSCRSRYCLTRPPCPLHSIPKKIALSPRSPRRGSGRSSPPLMKGDREALLQRLPRGSRCWTVSPQPGAAAGAPRGARAPPGAPLPPQPRRSQCARGSCGREPGGWVPAGPRR